MFHLILSLLLKIGRQYGVCNYRLLNMLKYQIIFFYGNDTFDCELYILLLFQEVPRVTLKLRKPRTDRKVKWSTETVDNENMNKKKSKCKYYHYIRRKNQLYTYKIPSPLIMHTILFSSTNNKIENCNLILSEKDISRLFLHLGG